MTVDPDDSAQVPKQPEVPKKTQWPSLYGDEPVIPPKSPQAPEPEETGQTPTRSNREEPHGSSGWDSFFKGCFYVIFALVVGFFLLLGTCFMVAR